MYLNGLGVQKNPNVAAKWFTNAAGLGIVPAQTSLGILYGRGEGVTKDDVLAYAWFYLAATTGDSVGINNRAVIEKRMSPGQIAEGKSLASKWRVGQGIKRLGK
jgi:TPR repeat protein